MREIVGDETSKAGLKALWKWDAKLRSPSLETRMKDEEPSDQRSRRKYYGSSVFCLIWRRMAEARARIQSKVQLE